MSHREALYLLCFKRSLCSYFQVVPILLMDMIPYTQAFLGDVALAPVNLSWQKMWFPAT